MAYFSDKGAHCDYKYCKQFDFLPLKCDLCNFQFCSDHFKPEDHQCIAAHKNEKRVIICPFCHTAVLLVPGEDPNYTLQFSHAPNCAQQAKKPKAKTCSIRGCQEVLTEINILKCNQCGVITCLKHRHHDLHLNLKSSLLSAQDSSKYSSSKEKKATRKRINYLTKPIKNNCTIQ